MAGKHEARKQQIWPTKKEIKQVVDQVKADAKTAWQKPKKG